MVNYDWVSTARQQFRLNAINRHILHIGEIAAKAHHASTSEYCILRCFLSGAVKLLVRAFAVYVRPIC